MINEIFQNENIPSMYFSESPVSPKQKKEIDHLKLMLKENEEAVERERFLKEEAESDIMSLKRECASLKVSLEKTQENASKVRFNE